MKDLKYTVIKNKKQYTQYCDLLETLVFAEKKTKEIKNEIELLSLLIKDWDDRHSTLSEVDPVQLLHSLMKENNLKQTDLVKILRISKGLVSEILNYKKGMSKEIIRKLSAHFKLKQEAFNRDYSDKLRQDYQLA
ncbi:MAG TPA: hypothetical protein VNB90_12865 [Cytophagaceae bacterium]|nr:hypothetical protein [Cytophagaceae bacterium]